MPGLGPMMERCRSSRSARSEGPQPGPEPGRTWCLRFERAGPPDGGPARVSVLPVLVLVPHTPGLGPTGPCVSSALRDPISPDASGTRRQPLGAEPRRGLLGSCGARPGAPGRRPDAFPRGPLACHAPSGSAASACATHTARAPSCPRRLSSLSHTHGGFSPSGMERGMLARPRLRRSWRSRQRPPLRNTGLTALP